MKKWMAMLLCLCTLFALVSCGIGKSGCSIEASDEKVDVGEEITFTVSLSKMKGVKSCGFRPEYDEEYFELVEGEMLLSGELGGFSDGIGTVAFPTETDIKGEVFTFTLKAKKATDGKKVGCQISIEDAQGVRSMTGELEKALIEIKE